MPFMALDTAGERWCSLDLGRELWRQPWVCQECEQPMVFVDAYTRRKHFRHLVESSCMWEPESEEHLEMKDIVCKIFRQMGYQCEFELKVGNRVPDIRAEKGTELLAVECQVSPLTVDQVGLKNKDYERIGVRPVWILHPENYLQKVGNIHWGYYRLKSIEIEFMDMLMYYDPRPAALHTIKFRAKFVPGEGFRKTLYSMKGKYLWGKL